MDDRAPTETRPADWQAVLLEALGEAAPAMVAVERAWHGWRVTDWITESCASLLLGLATGLWSSQLVRRRDRCYRSVRSTARGD
jgi:hypothetical protein